MPYHPSKIKRADQLQVGDTIRLLEMTHMKHTITNIKTHENRIALTFETGSRIHVYTYREFPIVEKDTVSG